MGFVYTEYSFERPLEMDPMPGAGGENPVVILGGGPVGMAVALDLARFGIRTVVLEAGRQVADGSRAICISRRSLEILDRLDCSAPVAEKGLWWTRGTSYYRKTPVFRLRMPHSENDKYPPFVNIQQYYLEAFMLDRVLASDLIDYRWRSEVKGLSQTTDGVSVTVRTPEGDYVLAAAYAVASDGARSAARDLLGLRLKGASHEGRYLIADIHLKTDLAVERRAWFDPEWNPGGTVLMHAQPDDIWRLDYQLREDEDDEAELNEARIRERIQNHLDYIGETGDWTLEWRSVYRAHALLLDDYRAGRVFFAGDAAHLVPIFGVRGLNSGYEDAHNLAWKLAAVLNGHGADVLLDSYSCERREATEFTLRAATKSTKFMTPPSRGYHVMREAVLSLAVSHEFVRDLISPRQSAPIGYVESPLLGLDEVGGAAFGARPGDHFPAAKIEIGGKAAFLGDVLGDGFSVLCFSSETELPPGTIEDLLTIADQEPAVCCAVVSKQGLTQNPGPLLDLADSQGELIRVSGVPVGGVIILRPDGHVLARYAEFDRSEVEKALRSCLKGGD